MGLMTLDDFTTRTVMPREDVDRLEAMYNGFIVARLAINESWINARLAKRYATPFAAPAPEIVLGWLTAITTLDAYQRRGWNPSSSEENQLIAKAAEDARTEVKEAADSETGLYDLPLRQDSTASGVSKGGPFGYSEASSYTFMDRQIEAVRNGY